jgi:hypothetical protein
LSLSLLLCLWSLCCTATWAPHVGCSRPAMYIPQAACASQCVACSLEHSLRLGWLLPSALQPSWRSPCLPRTAGVLLTLLVCRCHMLCADAACVRVSYVVC